MSLTNDQVKVIKLISGEELISELVSTDLVTGNITLKYPVSAVPTHDGSVLYMPFCAAADTDAVVIRASMILCDPLPAQKPVFDYYLQMVTPAEADSAIAVPNQDIIIPK